MGEARFQAVVTGDVQMVGYRAFACSQARRLGLSGYVRNLPDGSVEVVAEGNDKALAELLVELRRGPAASWVKELELSWQEPTGEFKGFSVTF